MSEAEEKQKSFFDFFFGEESKPFEYEKRGTNFIKN
jgi:hypothetical protein